MRRVKETERSAGKAMLGQGAEGPEVVKLQARLREVGSTPKESSDR
jgi:hypothetical protein